MANRLRHDLIKGCLSASGWLARSRHWTEEGGIPPFSESRRRGSTVRVRHRARQNRSTSGLSRSDRLATRRLSSAYGAVHGAFAPPRAERASQRPQSRTFGSAQVKLSSRADARVSPVSG